MTNKTSRRVFIFVLILAGLLVLSPTSQAECCDRNTKFGWNEGEHFRINVSWNAQERAAGSYASVDWPRGSLATGRALLFAAQRVLRDEWDINSVISAQHMDGGFAQLAETETNYWRQHTDYPPHVHINYVWPDWSGQVNTHFITTEDGKIKQTFLVWTVPGCTNGDSYPQAGEWWAEIDTACRPVWYQRWTADGAIELKLTEDSPVYRLVASDIEGDLSSAQVYLGEQRIYSINITLYDPINLKLILQIADYRNRVLTTETFVGNKDPWNTLTHHTVEEDVLQFLPTSSAECTYVVSTSGNDNNSGSPEEPWRSVNRAATSAQAGDTVCFRAGIWNERLEPAHSGTASAPITFTAYPGEEQEAVLDLGYMTGQKRYQGIVHIISKSYITVSNLKIMRAEDFGVLVHKSDHILISNNLIDYTWNSGIYFAESRNVIADGNDLQRVTHGQGGHPGHESISILGGTDGFTIRNNRIHNPFRDPQTGEPVSKEGIDAKDGVSNGIISGNYVNLGHSIGIYIDGFDAYVKNVAIFNNELVGNSYGLVVANEERGAVNEIRIYNNIIYQNRLFGIHITDWVNGGWIKNVDIVNNTIFANGDYGINVSNKKSENILIQNNISLGHTSQNLIVRGKVPADQVTTTNNLVSGDAQFVNAEGGDFHLLIGSPAIDTALSDRAPSIDRDGVVRPIGQADDIGAYEATMASR